MNPETVLRRDVVLDAGDVKYRVVDVLGQGGFGITYLVMGEIRKGNITTEGRFAIKELFPDQFCSRVGQTVVPHPDNEEEFHRSKADFIAEARKLHALGTQNDNIVRVNEVFEANGTAYYVMQFINGQSLAEYVKSRGKLGYREAVTLLEPIIDAVGYLHKSRINHLDIKPANIMLHEGAEGLMPVLIDFGLSMHFKKNGDRTTTKGVHGVSEGYSPLEQYAGIREFMPSADIYSLMATLLYCLTGERPESAATLRIADVRKVLEKSVPPEALDGICKALNKSYEARTQSVALLKSELGVNTPCQGNDTVVINVEGIRRKRRRIFVASVVGIAAVCLAAGIWLGMHASSFGDASTDNKADTATVTPPPLPILKDSITSEDVAKPEEEQTTPSTTKEEPQKQESTKPEPKKQEQKISDSQPSAPKPTASKATTGTLSLGYGIWSGGIRDGKPDGKGKLTFTAVHRVDRSTDYEGRPGDYFIATYTDGRLDYGKLYDSEGNLLKTIIP